MLLDGVRELVGPIAEYFPGVPAGALRSFRAEAPGVYGEDGGWRLHVRMWLVRHANGLMLVDTGVGQLGAPGPQWFGVAGALPSSLAEAGATPDDIDTVVLTHVHDDHVGGTVTLSGEAPEPAFPRATYVLQRADRVWQAELARQDEEEQLIDSMLLQPLERSGQLRLIEGDHVLADGIELHHAPGHTPGHQIVRVRSRVSHAIITGDTFNHPIQLANPEWPSGTDADPAQATRTRIRVLAELAAQPATTIAPTHFAEAFGGVRTDEVGAVNWRPR